MKVISNELYIKVLLSLLQQITFFHSIFDFIMEWTNEYKKNHRLLCKR